MKTHAHDNAHAAQRRAVAHQAEHGDAAAQLAQAGPAAVDHHVNHSPRMVAQRQLLGAAFGPVAQREPQGLEDELPVQGKALALQQPVQREAGLDDEEPAAQAKQARSGSGGTVQAQTEVPAEANLTGMPSQLKSGVEALSGMDMSDVRVHRNSDKPAQLNALAYAQGNEIHLGPGQEQHLPHEAWHVVQQRQGRVQATMQMAGVGVNDDVGLEEEADVMGGRAESGLVQLMGDGKKQDLTPKLGGSVQRTQTPSRLTDDAMVMKNAAPAQRMISKLVESDNGIRVTRDEKRPPGVIKDSEGDHMTPFVVLQHEIINAIADVDIDEAWGALKATYSVYEALSGWEKSKTSVQEGKSNFKGYIWDVPALLDAGGDIDALCTAANAMLALRNQIGLSAMKGKQAKGAGHAEATWAGGLHHEEKLERSGKATTATRKEVLFNMGMLFDHGRNDKRTDGDLAEETWFQHCETMVSAYFRLAKSLKIEWMDVCVKREYFSKEWHKLYG